MRLLIAATLLCCSAYVSARNAPSDAFAAMRQFVVVSRDGSKISGQVDSPSGATPIVAVVMVAGTGLFDRDMKFGRSGTDADLVFKDLSRRFVARGVTVVRYDRRGVRFGQPRTSLLDTSLSGSSTTNSQREDLNAVYRWAQARDGLAAKCVILFGHSEGTLHIARLAASGAPEPLGVIEVGAVAASPQAVMRWQMSERDAYSLRMMDVDHDGRTTAAEVDAHWQQTPSSMADVLAPLLPPDGNAWTSESLHQVEVVQTGRYDAAKATAMKLDDAGSYPNASTPMAKNSWWKSWFTDDVPAAKLLSTWHRTTIYLHWGAIDSQTPPSLNEPIARSWLGKQAIFTVHSSLGHTLGNHALLGPMNSDAADEIANEAQALARQCR